MYNLVSFPKAQLPMFVLCVHYHFLLKNFQQASCHTSLMCLDLSTYDLHSKQDKLLIEINKKCKDKILIAPSTAQNFLDFLVFYTHLNFHVSVVSISGNVIIRSVLASHLNFIVKYYWFFIKMRYF